MRRREWRHASAKFALLRHCASPRHTSAVPFIRLVRPPPHPASGSRRAALGRAPWLLFRRLPRAKSILLPRPAPPAWPPAVLVFASAVCPEPGPGVLGLASGSGASARCRSPMGAPSPPGSSPTLRRCRRSDSGLARMLRRQRVRKEREKAEGKRMWSAVQERHASPRLAATHVQASSCSAYGLGGGAPRSHSPRE
jgi:hypothetical protein